MQTGPAKGQRMSTWLLVTGLVEIANVAVFTFLAFVIIGGREGPWPLAWIGVLTLDLILLEGGVYWLLKRWSVGHALGEFVHYFVFKINMRAAERRLASQRGRLVRARLWRALARATAESKRKRATH